MVQRKDTRTAAATGPAAAMTPVALSHVVLNVRDLEESHHFYTEIVGFKQTGEWRVRPSTPGRRMRFYSGSHNGERYHHDLALVENRKLPPPPDWGIDSTPLAINHLAITLPNRDAWLKQLEFLQAKGVPFHRRINHGMAHSVYISDPNGYGVELLYELEREVWEGDIDEALNYVETLPREGEAALVDNTDNPAFGKA
jgi:catechol 2,3-dioxygenase